MKRLTGLLLALMLPMLALAANPPVEASMVLTGTITVNPDGSVNGYTLHEQDQVPPGVVNLVKQTVRGWQFVPILENGKPVTAKAGMTVRVVADVAGPNAKQMTVRVADAAFGCDARGAGSLLPNACPPDTEVEPVRRDPPEYPREALRGGAEGEVLLLVDIGRDGRVIHAAARQVNLYHRTRRDPTVMRKALAKAAEAAALDWQFKVPSVGPKADEDHWVVLVPINYMLAQAQATGSRLERRPRARPDYGRWSAYLPGPVRHFPWAGGDASDGKAASVAAGGAPFVRDARFVLKTPFGDDPGQS